MRVHDRNGPTHDKGPAAHDGWKRIYPGVVDFGSGSLGSFAQVDEKLEGVHSKQKSSNRRVLSKKRDAAASAVKPSWYGRSHSKRSAHSHANGNCKIIVFFQTIFHRIRLASKNKERREKREDW